jgi:hypothetical protein
MPVWFCDPRLDIDVSDPAQDPAIAGVWKGLEGFELVTLGAESQIKFTELATWYPAKPAISRPTAVISGRGGTTRAR